MLGSSFSFPIQVVVGRGDGIDGPLPLALNPLHLDTPANLGWMKTPSKASTTMSLFFSEPRQVTGQKG